MNTVLPISAKIIDLVSVTMYLFKDGHPYKEKKAYRHWMIMGEVYKTNEEFLDALKNIGSMEVIKGGKHETN